jgi:hypothetical protein
MSPAGRVPVAMEIDPVRGPAASMSRNMVTGGAEEAPAIFKTAAQGERSIQHT